MSKFLTNAAVIEFDNEVKHQYQGKSKLRPHVTSRAGVIGESYKFTRMGRGLANQKASQADITPMDITHARQTCTLENWIAGEYTDIFDAKEVNFDEQRELASTIAGALGRRDDQLIIDAMNSVTYATTNDGNADTGLSIDISGSRNFDFEVVRRARQHFQELETDGELCFAVQAGALQELLSANQVTSSDFVTVKALLDGTMNSWMGFEWVVIGSRTEGGLPGATGDEIAFAWEKSALGYANGIDMYTTVDWVAHKASWLAQGHLKAGAIAREPQGIVKVIYDETA